MEMVAKRSSLVLPKKFVELDREEMTYVDGGGTTIYRGWDTIMEITNMIANVIGWGALALKCGAFLLEGAAIAVSGVGAVLAFVSAIGLSWSLAMAIINLITTIMAIGFYLNNGGFKVTNFGLFGFGINLVSGL